MSETTPKPPAESFDEESFTQSNRAVTKSSDAVPSKRRKISKRNVLLWEYFEETNDPNVVLCKATDHCKAKLRRPDGSTSGMRSHFENRHPLLYVQYLEKSGSEAKQKVWIFFIVI
jgi:hypothetical protein